MIDWGMMPNPLDEEPEPEEETPPLRPVPVGPLTSLADVNALRAELVQKAAAAGQYAACRGLLQDIGAALGEKAIQGPPEGVSLTVKVEGPPALPPQGHSGTVLGAFVDVEAT
jgi:hypothetical protein